MLKNMSIIFTLEYGTKAAPTKIYDYFILVLEFSINLTKFLYEIKILVQTVSNINKNVFKGE